MVNDKILFLLTTYIDPYAVTNSQDSSCRTAAKILSVHAFHIVISLYDFSVSTRYRVIRFVDLAIYSIDRIVKCHSTTPHSITW